MIEKSIAKGSFATTNSNGAFISDTSNREFPSCYLKNGNNNIEFNKIMS